MHFKVWLSSLCLLRVPKELSGSLLLYTYAVIYDSAFILNSRPSIFTLRTFGDVPAPTSVAASYPTRGVGVVDIKIRSQERIVS